VSIRIKRLGRTGLKVSEVCMGTMTFGHQSDERTAQAILDRALDAGINFVDTADMYPVPPSIETAGRTEEIVGRWLAGKRSRIVLATKCRNRMGPGPNDEGLSRAHILDAVDASLRRLQTDYIDLYQVHAPDPETPLDETLRALDDLVRWGKVRYIGCSNFEAWRLYKALWVSDRLRLARFDCVQPRYSLLYREIERDLLPICVEEGVGVIAFNPLAAGLLTGKYRRGESPPEGTRFAMGGPYGALYRGRYWHDALFDAVDKVKEVAENCNATPAQVAIAWMLQQPAVTSAILGATRVEQLDETLKAVDLTLDAAAMDALNAVSPPTPIVA
jgi:aryl-alcohol dehydrogenase-like predicted oxidoreductase